MTQVKGSLILLPNLLGTSRHWQEFLPEAVRTATLSLNGLIAESDRAARRFLSLFMEHGEALKFPVATMTKPMQKKDIDFLLEPITQGQRWGLISDAGLPCLADPGCDLVFRARQCGLVVEAHMGPSSPILALMLSGLPAQRFSFLGYLDQEPEARCKTLLELERRSLKEQSTQIWMETPYRNEFVLKDAVDTLAPTTWLAVASNLTETSERVICQQVSQWRSMPLPKLEKKPAIFLLAAK